MSNLNVLMVVDVEGALAGTLQDNIYLIDSNKNFGSGAEGQAELNTACTDGQVIVWSVTPVDPSTDVVISGFSGGMVGDNICNPQPVTGPDGTTYEGRVDAQGVASVQQYSATLTMDGRLMSFDPFLTISVAG